MNAAAGAPVTGIYRTAPDAAVPHPAGWARVGDVDVTVLPMLDSATGLFARLSYADLEMVAVREGARLVSMATLLDVWHVGLRLLPVTLVGRRDDTRHMRGRAFCERHDVAVRAQLESLRWDGREPVANAGKQWIRGASPGKARNGGWYRTDGVPIQPGGPGSEHHDRDYTDYSQLATLERDVLEEEETVPDTDRPGSDHDRRTLRRGDRGVDVAVWQSVVGASCDGVFGGATEAATKVWQSARRLVADGIVGERSWRAAGQTWAPSAVPTHGPSPACLAALRDATAHWPTRRRTSDGIMGDARHQASVSDHNLGNAVDISHDPSTGCDGHSISLLATQDPRTQYVIWSRHIWNRDRIREGWRAYGGSNPHTSHVHVSVRVALREDDGPWPWATGRD